MGTWTPTLLISIALAVVGCSSNDSQSTDSGVDTSVDLLCVADEVDSSVDCDNADCAMHVSREGACVNDNDLPRFRDLDYNVEWNACIAQCQLGVECLAACFTERNGTSLECSTCFAEMIPCVVSQCASQCPNGGGSPECLACIGSSCVPPYKECFGQLSCPWEYGCRDQIDNDDDGLTDLQDPECQQ